ncbi:serine protease inhibitor 28Dc-like [Condylostylus longicornis]|uniref:serine protease inhibitor 28Dc-like n=1 Tax=Condylostylus longicornis TaxID=2530218 RepID=UPI00244E0491|nr:serine protease inhibitor 28Dc-like [Condylostylus longicornis]
MLGITGCESAVYAKTKHNSGNIKFRTHNPVREGLEYATKVDELLSRNVLEIAQNLLTLSTKYNTNIKYQVFSPIGIANVLSLLALGAKSNTQEELIKILGFDKVPNFDANLLRVHEEFGILIDNLTKDNKIDEGNLSKVQRNKRKRSSSLSKIDPKLSSIPSEYRNLKKYHIFRRSIPSKRSYIPNFNYENYDNGLQSKFNDHEIDIANGIFIQSGYQLKSDYENFVKSIYRSNSEIVLLDFENNSEYARQYINDWGKRKTNGKIENLIMGDIDTTTNMIITSALYFRSLWQTSFIESITMKRNFYPDGYSSPPVLVDMMANGGEYLYYDASEYECRFIGLPFKDSLSIMYIMIPYDSNKEKLEQLQKLLTSDRIDEIISKRMRKKMILLNLPRMHLENSMNLRELFTQMGIKSLFNSRESDLSGIISSLTSSASSSSSSPSQASIPITENAFSNDESIILKGDKSKSKLELLLKKNSKFYNNHPNSKPLLHSNQPIRNIGKIVFVDDIVHKVNLKINEQGIEGAATTVSHLPRNDFDEEFIVNAPFLFLVRHEKTKLPIFYGSVYDPSI